MVLSLSLYIYRHVAFGYKFLKNQANFRHALSTVLTLSLAKPDLEVRSLGFVGL